MKRQFALAVMVTALLGAYAQAQVTVAVFPSIGPDGNNSPNAGGYSYNALNALYSAAIGGIPPVLAGPGTQGNAPSAYAASSSGSTSQVITTFPQKSWNGIANPGGAYAAETGNSAYGGAAFVTNPTISLNQISLSSLTGGLSFNAPSGPPTSLIPNGTPFPNPTIGATSFDGVNAVGVLANDSILGNGNDTYVIGVDQPVDAILFRGIFSSDTLVQNTGNLQADIDATIAAVGSFNYNWTYGATTQNGSMASGSSALVLTVPEPACMVVFGAGLVVLFGQARRRRHVAPGA